MKRAISLICAALALASCATAIIICLRCEKARPELTVSYGSGYARVSDAAADAININTANVEALCTLPGIGEATAKKIIAYREACGPFGDTSDIIDVKGIGLATFEAIRDKITV